MVKNHNIKIFTVFALIIFSTCFAFTDDSRNHKITATYCDGTTVVFFPYSLVTRGDQTTYKCYKVQVSSIKNGKQYRFEDQSDMDYNDLVIDVWVSRDKTFSPQINIKFVSSDAGFNHKGYLYYSNHDVLVFDADKIAAGTVIVHRLPKKDCPDFQLGISPESHSIQAGESAVYTITANPLNNFSETLKLKASGLPPGSSAVFNPQSLIPGNTSELTLTTSTTSDPGKFPFTITAESNSKSQTVSAELEIFNLDLKITKTVNKINAKPGDSLKYNIILENNSSKNLTNLTIQDQISQHLEILSQTSNFTYKKDGMTLIWKGNLKQNKKITITLTTRIKNNLSNGTDIYNQAEVESADLPTPQKSNQVKTTVNSIMINQTKILFHKNVNLPQTEVGRIVRFNFTVANQSRSTLFHPAIEDFLPQGFRYVKGSTLYNYQKFTDPSGKTTLRWKLPDINPGQTCILSFQTIIGSDTRRGKNINNASFTCRDNSGQLIKLHASKFINVSTLGFQFFCGIEGTVYLDRNSDKFYSIEDTPLENIEVRLSTGEKSYTNRMGQYQFENLYAGEYAVAINNANLPEKYRLIQQTPKVVVLTDGLTDTADFAVRFKGEETVNTSRLEGKVYYDKNFNKIYDNNDPLVTAFRVKLNNIKTTAGKNGKFIFSHLPPGKYSLEIHYGPKIHKTTVVLEHGKNYTDIPLPFSGIKIIVSGDK